jgi:type III secretion protein Q
MQARSYPFERLPHVPRAQLGWLRAVARALPEGASERLQREAALLLGATLRVRSRAPELVATSVACASLCDPCCMLRLSLAGDALGRGVLLELPAGAAAVLCDRMLGGDGALPLAPPSGLDPLSRGVLGYLAARLCAASGAALQLHGVESERARALSDLPEGWVLLWPLELELAGAPLGTARAWISQASAGSLLLRPAPVARINPPGALLDLQVTACAHLGQLLLARGEADALLPGDVLIPDRGRLTRENGGHYAGELELHTIGCRSGFSCRLDGSRLVIERLIRCGESTMTDTKRISIAEPAISELAADTPLELCIELARFTMTLRELSALRPGEVLDGGSRVGAHVVLSAGGRAIARGELVEIDGAIGMRVIELLR